MTMQTFCSFSYWNELWMEIIFLTLIAYIIEGALGLPVFATGAGFAYLMGPTAGYIYGMLLAAIVLVSYQKKVFQKLIL